MRGETGAFEMLVEKYQKPIYNLAFRMTKNLEAAEDLTQTVFIKAFQKLDSFRFNYKFFSWIYRIAVNESLNFLSQRKRFTDLDSKIISTEKTPEEIVQQEELNRQLQDGLMVLNPDYRILIILKHFHMFSYREIAFIVDIPGGFTDPATALPVQIFLWADSPERAFVERTSAAIMVLLAFLITMNAAAVILRKRFERRW